MARTKDSLGGGIMVGMRHDPGDMVLFHMFYLLSFAKPSFIGGYGYREAVQWRLDHQQEFPQAIVSGLCEYPEIFFLFIRASGSQRMDRIA